MDVFVSYSSANRELAEKLKTELQQRGISAWSDTNGEAPQLRWSERIEQAVRKAEAIILLIEPQIRTDERLSRVWQEALQAVWSDSSKRMIPFLLGDAAPPAFARTTVPRTGSLPVVRARDPQADWEQAVNNLVALLHNEADPSQIELVPAWTKQDQEHHERWQAQFGAYIENQIANLNLTPAEWRARKAQP
jgi:hypothetical protein